MPTPSLVIYEISADPLSNTDVDVLAAYTVDVIDDDPDLDATDASGPQLDVSGVPGFIGDSTSFQVFESYTGNIGGVPVTFTLLQWQGTQYMVVNEGTVTVGDTIAGTNNTIVAAPDDPYVDLPDYVCFTKGTKIETPQGPKNVEDLVGNDVVITASGETAPIRWIGRHRLSEGDLAKKPHLSPIIFKPNALAPGIPTRNVSVSPQHRIAMRSEECLMNFGTSDVLVSAKSLVNDKKIAIDHSGQSVTYYHLLLDAHELVSASGLWAETLFLGDSTIESLPRWTLARLRQLSKSRTGIDFTKIETALPVLKTFEVDIVRESLRPFETEVVDHNSQTKITA